MSGGAGSPGSANRPRKEVPLSPVEKPATVRCLGPVDAMGLTAQVKRLSREAWLREDRFKPNRFPCFHHTWHIVLRFIPRFRDPRRFCSEPGWRLWRPWLLPLMTQAAGVYGFAEPIFPRAMLARLEAGQRIDTHEDGEGSNLLVHKVHVPLQTEPEAIVTVDGASMHLAAGYAWEINNLAAHGAFNGGRDDRIHFIFEVFEGAGHEVFEAARQPGAPHGGEESGTGS